MTATSVAVMMIARDRTIFTSLNDCNMTPPPQQQQLRFGWANGLTTTATATTLITLQTFPGLLKPDYGRKETSKDRGKKCRQEFH